jgi:kinesin family protein C2/C3
MADKARIESLVNMYINAGPASGTVLAELCELIRHGHAPVILDAMKGPLKKERAALQLRVVSLLDHCVSSTGVDCVQHVATEAWMERLVRISKQTAFPELKVAIERLVFKWANTYGYPPFLQTADRIRSSNPQPMQTPRDGSVQQQQQQPRLSSQNNNMPQQPQQPSMNRQGSFVSSGGGSVAAGPPRVVQQHHNHTDAISPVDLLIMNIQADLGNVEVALQRPEMMKGDTVADILRDRAKLSALLDGGTPIADSTRHNLLILQSSIDEVIGLYNAIYGPAGAQGNSHHRGSSPKARKVTNGAPQSPTFEGQLVKERAPQRRQSEEVPPEVLAELEAERARLDAKLQGAKAKNKKAQSHIEKVSADIEARKAAERAAQNAPRAPLVTKLPQHGPVAICARRSLAMARSLHAEIKTLRSQVDKIRTESQACAQMKSSAGGLLAAVEDDKKSDMASLTQLQDLYMAEMKLRKQYYNTIQELKGNIRVYCRARPMSDNERSKGHTEVTSFPAEGELVVNDIEKGKNRTFEFDACFGPNSKQEEVFEDTKPLIDSVVDGYNVCIFAYGQTGSGKTHTMSGPDHCIGINRRALCRLFEIVDERKETEQCTVEVAVLEIYNEEIRDLTRSRAEAASLSFDVKTGGETGHYVTNLNFTPVHAESQIQELIQRASSNRSEGRTNMNQHSSRSHMILYVIVRTVNLQTGLKTFGKLSLVDLAGSERLDKSGATGDMLIETVHINKSLSALGDVICSLSSSAGHVPYRNSKLTFLLQDSMTGQAKVLMFVCVSPASYNTSETLSSLQFATRARGVSLGQAKRNFS